MGHTALSKFQAFVRGCMVGLVINLSILPMAQAQQATSGGGNVSGVSPIDSPQVHPPTINPADELLRMHREFYEALFSNGWDQNQSCFLLADEAHAPGSFLGFNEVGEAFELDVVDAAEPSYDGLPAADRERVMNSGVRAAAILCVIRSDAAEFLCQGVSLTIDDGKSVRSEFFPTVFIEALYPANTDGTSDGQSRPPYPPGGRNCWGWLGDCTWCLAGILAFGLSTFFCIGTTGPAAIACILLFIFELGGLLRECVNCAGCLNGPRWASSVPRE